MEEILAKYHEQYLLLGFDHTFLSTTLPEEALLFGIRQPEALVNEVKELFLPFKEDFAIGQSINKLSGGENAILCLIFYSCLAKYLHKPVKILLYNLMESLSQLNRTKLQKALKHYSTYGIRFYILKNNEVQEING